MLLIIHMINALNDETTTATTYAIDGNASVGFQRLGS